jgi:hypothetical protein
MFKGSGFYKTDYRSESYKSGAEKAKKARSKAKDKDKSKDSSSSSKPEKS